MKLAKKFLAALAAVLLFVGAALVLSQPYAQAAVGQTAGCVHTIYTDAANGSQHQKSSASVVISTGDSGQSNGTDFWQVTANPGWNAQSASVVEEFFSDQHHQTLSGLSGTTDPGSYVFSVDALACPVAPATTVAPPTTAAPTTQPPTTATPTTVKSVVVAPPTTVKTAAVTQAKVVAKKAAAKVKAKDELARTGMHVAFWAPTAITLVLFGFYLVVYAKRRQRRLQPIMAYHSNTQPRN
jgi:hypothetical protein